MVGPRLALAFHTAEPQRLAPSTLGGGWTTAHLANDACLYSSAHTSITSLVKLPELRKHGTPVATTPLCKDLLQNGVHANCWLCTKGRHGLNVVVPQDVPQDTVKVLNIQILGFNTPRSLVEVLLRPPAAWHNHHVAGRQQDLDGTWQFACVWPALQINLICIEPRDGIVISVLGGEQVQTAFGTAANLENRFVLLVEDPKGHLSPIESRQSRPIIWKEFHSHVAREAETPLRRLQAVT